MLIPLLFNHLFSESHQKNIWAQPYFCLGCLLKSATDKLLLSAAPAKSGPLDFPSEKSFLLFFAHEKVDGRREMSSLSLKTVVVHKSVTSLMTETNLQKEG